MIEVNNWKILSGVQSGVHFKIYRLLRIFFLDISNSSSVIRLLSLRLCNSVSLSLIDDSCFLSSIFSLLFNFNSSVSSFSLFSLVKFSFNFFSCFRFSLPSFIFLSHISSKLTRYTSKKNWWSNFFVLLIPVLGFFSLGKIVSNINSNCFKGLSIFLRTFEAFESYFFWLL